jgi:hypothetical protein
MGRRSCRPKCLHLRIQHAAYHRCTSHGERFARRRRIPHRTGGPTRSPTMRNIWLRKRESRSGAIILACQTRTPVDSSWLCRPTIIKSRFVVVDVGIVPDERDRLKEAASRCTSCVTQTLRLKCHTGANRASDFDNQPAAPYVAMARPRRRVSRTSNSRSSPRVR